MNRLWVGACLVLSLLAASGWSVATAQELPPPDEPRSWIPKYAPRDRIDAQVDPPQSETQRLQRAETEASKDEPANAAIGTCIEKGVAAATREPPQLGRRTYRAEFYDALNSANALIKGGSALERALELITAASALATTPQEMLALAETRYDYFRATGDRSGLIASLEEQVLSGALYGEKLRARCMNIDSLRNNGAIPPSLHFTHPSR